MVNCTLIDNRAGSQGGGIRYFDGLAIDCIIWGNSASTDPNLFECSDPSFSCIEDWDGAGEGNIHDDPMFVTGPLGGYYLHPDSPCIDTGSRSAQGAGLSDRTTQADGTPDTGQVDMGYHYPIP